jgi:putative lipoprotein
MRRLMPSLLLVAAACTGAEPPSRRAAEPPAEPSPEGASGAREARYRAMGATFVGSGNEPGWLLAMWPDSVVLVANYGADTVRFPAAAPEVLEDGRRHWGLRAGGRTFSLAISPEPCRDDMSGAAFPATIQYVLDSLPALRGCGTPLSE